MLRKNEPHTKYLPTSAKEVKKLGWSSIDVIIFSGDAYVDHPAFGTAIIARYLESLGLRVAVVPQPNWKDDLRDFRKLGAPNLFFAVTSGNMDSMVNHYTAQKRLRSDDAYTAGNKARQRPDYAVTVYSNILKELYPESIVIIGGIESSLRRLTHYDYWSDSLKKPVLIDSKADYLVYGMAEQTLKKIVEKFRENQTNDIKNIPQLAYTINNDNTQHIPVNHVELPSYQDCLKDKQAFARSFVLSEKEWSKRRGKALVQKIYDKTVIINPAFPPLEEDFIDAVYALPYTREPHPRYEKKGIIPAYEMIKNSVTIHRGCFGGCAFCALTAHQTKYISSRSASSIVEELKKISSKTDFKGHISDLGGPSANMYKMTPYDKTICDSCSRPSCIHPNICKNLNTSHLPLTKLYQQALKISGVKKITIGSGIRYDLFMQQKDSPEKGFEAYRKQLFRHHISGRLKVAPEHTSNSVLKQMRKPSFEYFLKFRDTFINFNNQNQLKQQLVPYFISGHPGTTISDMAELSATAKKLKLPLEQVQDFTPTPMTLSSVIFYTGKNPYDGEDVFVPKKLSQKKAQNQFFFYYKKENKTFIKDYLLKINRPDIIRCLFDR